MQKRHAKVDNDRGKGEREGPGLQLTQFSEVVLLWFSLSPALTFFARPVSLRLTAQLLGQGVRSVQGAAEWASRAALALIEA